MKTACDNEMTDCVCCRACVGWVEFAGVPFASENVTRFTLGSEKSRARSKRNSKCEFERRLRSSRDSTRKCGAIVSCGSCKALTPYAALWSRKKSRARSKRNSKCEFQRRLRSNPIPLPSAGQLFPAEVGKRLLRARLFGAEKSRARSKRNSKCEFQR